MGTDTKYDCIVVGAGIAGLGAALTMQDAGLNVLVLEADSRVGGRMTTDRIDGYCIDRGVSVLSNGYLNMKALVKRLGLEQHKRRINFAFSVKESGGSIDARAGRIDDLVLARGLSQASRLAAIRIGMAVIARMDRLHHGMSNKLTLLDDESIEAYVQRLHGSELLDKIIYPTMASIFGGHLEQSSRLTLLQSMRNVFLAGTFAMDHGMDMIPEAMARLLPVRLNRRVTIVRYDQQGATVIDDDGYQYSANAVILAVPGNKVADLCPGLPGSVQQLLVKTGYGKMTNTHIALNKPMAEKHVIVAAAKEYGVNYVAELERNRCMTLCPAGKDMVSLFGWDTNDKRLSELSDEALDVEAQKALGICVPDAVGSTQFSHTIRWVEGIALFPTGRIKEISELRNEMRTWDIPVQLCGDYLDGIASESALQTGIEAAQKIINDRV